MNDVFNQMRLGSLITELPKSVLPASAAEVGGHYHFFCSSAEVRAISSWLQEKPAVIMGTGGVASVNYGHEKYAYSTDTWCFRSQRDDVQIKYLFRKIQQLLPKIEYVGFEGSGLKHLRKEVVKALLIDIPKKIVQNKIIEILDAIDASISVTESLIAKYQKIKAGLMHDLFTRGVTADGKLRPPREQAPELYQGTPIGWIPKAWQIILMVDLAEDRKGATTIGPFGSDLVTTDYRLEGVPVIFVRDIKEPGFEWNSETYVSDKKSLQLRAHSVKAGEVLVTKMGLPPCISCLFPEWMPNGVITADMIRLSPDNKKVNGYWLTAAINHDRVKRQVAGITAGVTRMKVTLADFRGIKIAKPELDEQRLISDKLRVAQNNINAELARVDKLQSQKLGLMQDLLTGKVPVKIDESDQEFA